jgi:NADH-quinone oxidoreductase subunit L
MAIGISAAWMLYRNKSRDALAEAMPKRLFELVFDKWRVDELYGVTIVKPIKQVATVAGRADMTFVDALMTKLPSFNVLRAGRIFARMQNGVVQMYGAVMIVGLVAVLAFFWAPHSHIEVTFQGNNVDLTTPLGLGYEYRWDANSDGEFETTWADAPATSFTYQKDDVRGVAVFIMNARSGVERRVDVGEDWVPLPIEAVAPAATLRRDDLGFEVRRDGEELVFRRPDPPTLLAGSKELRLPLGKDGRLGPARVIARPVVEATVEVRNAFGNQGRRTKEITLPFWIEEPPSHAALTPRNHEVVR